MKKVIIALLILVVVIVAGVLIFLNVNNNNDNNNENNNHDDENLVIDGETVDKQEYSNIELPISANYMYVCDENTLYLGTADGSLYLYDLSNNTFRQIALDKDAVTSNVIDLFNNNELYIEVEYKGVNVTKSILIIDYTNANILEEIPLSADISNVIISQDETYMAYTKNNNMYVSLLDGNDEQLLLEGIVDGESSTVGYNPIKFINETEILYHCGAWEGSLGMGVIDFITLKNIYFENGLCPVGYDEQTNMAYCVNAYALLYDVEKVNIEDGNGEQILSDILNNNDYFLWEWSGDFSKIAIMKDDKNVEIYDTSTGELSKTVLVKDGSVDSIRIKNDNIFIYYYKIPEDENGDITVFVMKAKI